MLKATLKETRPDFHAMLQLSACAALYFEGKAYKAEIRHYTFVDCEGNLQSTTETIICDGTVDGYDKPCGVRFDNTSEANKYFTFEFN